MTDEHVQTAAEKAGVPATIEELHDRYDRLITWAIRRKCHKIDPETLQDYRQQVYVRVIERDFLARCRAYYERTGSGRFGSSLVTLVTNLVHRQNYERKLTDPLALRDDFAVGPRPSRDRHDSGENSLEYVAPLPSHERAIEARDILDVIGRRLEPRKWQTPARAVLAAAVHCGLHSKSLGAATGANASTVRHYLVSIRAEAQRLEPLPCLTVATKSAATSSDPASRPSRR